MFNLINKINFLSINIITIRKNGYITHFKIFLRLSTNKPSESIQILRQIHDINMGPRSNNKLALESSHHTKRSLLPWSCASSMLFGKREPKCNITLIKLTSNRRNKLRFLFHFRPIFVTLPSTTHNTRSSNTQQWSNSISFLNSSSSQATYH